MTDLPPPPAEAGETVDLRADPMILASGVLVALGLILLIAGVAGSWHWKAAIWGATVASIAAFALVAVSANQRRLEFRTEDDEPDVIGESEPAVDPVAASVAAKVKATDEPAPPRPRFAGFGKNKAPAPTDAPVLPAAPVAPPQPSNVQVMHVQGSNVRVAPTPQPMPLARPERAVAKPPSAPPPTPPTIQVGAPRTPGFKTYQPVDPDAVVIQVRNRYHRSDCRYVTVADDAVTTTVGAARASNAMPCGVCRP
ncbi:hypothetical protein acdb102_38100 [Acidothermaceae bacterium B102]|nr:hypothetical protein acdb102_38100 [Acidothermaceae bacterium B102]